MAPKKGFDVMSTPGVGSPSLSMSEAGFRTTESSTHVELYEVSFTLEHKYNR